MSISTKCAEALIWIYKGVNRIGLLESKLFRSAYIQTYFTYKKYIEDSFEKLIKNYPYLFRHGNIIDIGANIGYTSYIFSKVIDANYKIYAFEPEERNISILNQASNKYKFSHRLVPVKAAVGNYEGEVDLWHNEKHNGDHRILTEDLKKTLDNNIKIQRTKLVTIDNYLKQFDSSFPISFIKIDVQGYELAVCEGMSDTLSRSPDTVIGFEYCPSIIESLGFDPKALLAFFQSRGYKFYILNKMNRIEEYNVEKGNILLRKIRPHDYIDILCSRKSLLTS